MCLVAPSGFSNDGKGHPTIPNGNNSFLTSNTCQGIFTFKGDGTGHVTGIHTSIIPPSPDSRSAPKPSMAGGTFTYDVTTTPIVDHRFLATSKRGTRGVNRGFIVSDDQKTMGLTVNAPYVETVTY
jgi:hypothetical protein